MSLVEKLTSIKTNLDNAMSDINTALVAKGVSEVTTLYDVPTAIESVQSGGGVAKIQAPEDMTLFLPALIAEDGACDDLELEVREWFVNLIFNNIDYSQTLSLREALTEYDMLTEDIELNIKNLNAQSVEDMRDCFWGVTNLFSVNNVNNKCIKKMDMAFSQCINLHTITNLKLLGEKPINSYRAGVFGACESLVNLSLMEGEEIELSGSHTDLGNFKTVDVSESPLLSLESLVGILNAVVNKNASGNIRVYFGSENIAKLSVEHLALAAEKRIELV